MMPTVSVGRDRLFAALEQTYSKNLLLRHSSCWQFFFVLLSRARHVLFCAVVNSTKTLLCENLLWDWEIMKKSRGVATFFWSVCELATRIGRYYLFLDLECKGREFQKSYCSCSDSSCFWLVLGEAEFDELCFEFGIELDDVVGCNFPKLRRSTCHFLVHNDDLILLKSSAMYSHVDCVWQTTEKAIVRKEKHLDHEEDEDEDEEIIYKIDVPANRSVSVLSNALSSVSPVTSLCAPPVDGCM